MNLAAVPGDTDEIDTGDLALSLQDEGEAGADAQATHGPTGPAKPRPRAVPAPRPVDPSVPMSNFGGVPEGVTHWRMRRQQLGGGWEALSHAEPGAIAAVRVWPLAELKEEAIRERWGAGRYQVQWVRPTAGGGSNVLRGGQLVEILPETPPASATPVHAAALSSSLGPEVDRTLQMMRMIAGEADAKMSSVLQFAAALAGRQNNGFGAAELELIMRNNREATAAAVAAAVAPLQAELASMRAELDGEDDDEPGIVGAAAGAAASSGLLRGKGAWVQAANFAAGNPELVKAALPIVADTLSKIAAIFTPAKPRPVPMMPPPAPSSPPMPPPAASLHGDAGRPVNGSAPVPAPVVPPAPAAPEESKNDA